MSKLEVFKGYGAGERNPFWTITLQTAFIRDGMQNWKLETVGKDNVPTAHRLSRIQLHNTYEHCSAKKEVEKSFLRRIRSPLEKH